MDASIPALPPTEAPALRIARAAVDVGTVTTYYRRAGSGPPVLLLSSGGVGAALFEPLSSRFRVVAPEPVAENGAEAPAFSCWMRDFLDGLGLMRASIVAEERFGLPALSFALTDPERVEGLVLLFRDADDPAIAGNSLPDELRQSGQPLLVLRTGSAEEPPAPSGEPVLAQQVLGFLSEAAA